MRSNIKYINIDSSKNDGNLLVGKREYQLVTVLHRIIQFEHLLPYNSRLLTIDMKEGRRHKSLEKKAQAKSESSALEDGG
jgi:hypothetical protein